MKLTRIAEENLEYFAPLLPPTGVGEEQEALGVIGDDDRPCAAVVIELLDDEISLEWLYVHPDYRRIGIGSHLLRAVELYGSQAAETIRVSFTDDLIGCSEFFLQEGYFLTRGDAAFCVSVLDDFRQDEYEKLLNVTSKKATLSLEELTPQHFPMLQKFLQVGLGTDAYLSECTPAYSYCIGSGKGEFEGCLFVKELPENLFQPVLLFNNGSNTNTLLLLKRLFCDLDAENREHVYLQFVTSKPSILRFVENMAKDPEAIRQYEIRCAVKALGA